MIAPQHSEPPLGEKNLDKRFRMLIPVDVSEKSQWCIRYAIDLSRRKIPVEVLLLFIAEPVRNWEVLRFHTESEVRQHFQERSEVFLNEAADALRDAGLSCSTHFREADPIRGIMEFAEEHNCSEIVVPDTLWLGLIPYGLASRLPRGSAPMTVTRVNRDGIPSPSIN